MGDPSSREVVISDVTGAMSIPPAKVLTVEPGYKYFLGNGDTQQYSEGLIVRRKGNTEVLKFASNAGALFRASCSA